MPPPCAQRDDSWQVRVCDAQGRTVGAGVLLGQSRVLTCAHVVRMAAGSLDPGAPVWAESSLCQTRWRIRARLVPDCWIAEHGTERGDVALLELDTPVTCHRGARLRRAPTRGVAVWVRGFPDGDRVGVTAGGRLAGPSYDGDWVEMHAPGGDRGQWVTQGYSGAGVASQATGHVVGILVSVREVDARVNAFLMPAELIVSYLPAVEPFVDGGGTIDHTFDHPAPADDADAGARQAPELEAPAELALRQEVTRLFAGTWSGTVVITGSAAGSQWLARLVTTADPAARSRMSDEAMAGTARGAALGVGAIDLAVDAAGRTLREVQHRVAERFDLPGDDLADLVHRLSHRSPPPVIVIDRIDDAAEPGPILSELLVPLAARARRRGIRLVLGFTGHPPDGLPYQFSLDPGPITGTPRGAADPDATRRLLTTLAKAEDELAMLGASVQIIKAPEPPPCLAPQLRVRYAVATAGGAPTAELPLIHAAAEEALPTVARMAGRLRELRRALDDLGLELEVYRLNAERRLDAEDGQLSTLYREARRILRSVPCDLGAARLAVEAYRDGAA